jgi:hypothetical protein
MSIAESLHQHVRPSPHSLAVLASHLAFAKTIHIAWKSHRVVESLSLALSCLISLHYHLCDENLWCPYGFDVYFWHAMDVWSTFFLICFVFGVMVLDLKKKKHQFILRVAYFIAVTASVAIDRSSMLLFGSLLGSVGLLVVVRLLSECGWFRARSSTKDSPSKSLSDLALGVGAFTVALGCFMVANTPVIGYVRYDRSKPKPMDVPDTSVYWFFHSCWHLISSLSAYLILRFLSQRPQRN